MTLHWIRATSLSQWLEQNRSLLDVNDALLLSDKGLENLPRSAPLNNTCYALSQEITTALPDYVTLIDDPQWLELVLNFPHQITW
ncbi:hypothetical protein [Idiomarina sp.]|uniref:hypothetical protein n=1 Tax=Idiomarina sp. TaxID=1874361 RepID=UPI000C8D49FC|nr:hypothetical protein [Idiomarina sp.]MAK70705.1 hypothetical protein [Idiomarinaceae bacterium]